MILDQGTHSEKKPQASIAGDLSALSELIQVAKTLLGRPQTGLHEKVLKSLAVSMSNSAVATAILCNAGHGADAVKIARSILEARIIFRYLLNNSRELGDFLEFDAIARYNRLQYYRSELPQLYASLPAVKIKEVTDAYKAARPRFSNSRGKIQKRWSRHSLGQMARVVGLEDMYDLFYRYASYLHHTDPMGLAMLIDGETLEVQPGPTGRHTDIAIRMATSSLHETLSGYSKLIGIDCSEDLQRIDRLISTPIEYKGNPLGSLAEALALPPGHV